MAVARAAIWGRRVLILDEPVAALAPQQTANVLALMDRVRRERDLAVIFISHTLPHVFEVADRVSVMRRGRRVLCQPIARGHDARDHRSDGRRRRAGGRHGARMSAATARATVAALIERESAFLLLLLAGICVAFTLLTPRGTFLSTLNATNIALDTAEILVLAAGMTFIIIAAGIDLSIGSLVVFSSVAFAELMTRIAGTSGVFGGAAPAPRAGDRRRRSSPRWSRVSAGASSTAT